MADEDFKPVAAPRAGAGEPDEDAGGTEDERLLALAKSQFQQVIDAESVNRQYMRDDMRFRAASPDDNYQWPSELLQTRRGSNTQSARPCLTVNKLPAHVNQVVNDWRQNRPQFKVSPVDSGADVKVAEVLNGVVRHIQVASDADVAYDTALDGAVVAGVGYIRVLTDYVDPMSFDQDILIRRVRDPLSVFMDPFIQQPDGSDQRFCFVVEDMPRKIFEHEWPETPVEGWDTGGAFDEWLSQDAVRVAEWWNLEYRRRTLCQYPDGTTGWKDEKPEGGPTPVREREVDVPTVVFRRITCGAILETIEWPGRFIPIARAVGNEYDIEGKLITSGMIRTAKDAQRMYNYWASQEVEMLALAPKAPFIAPVGSLAGRETQWKMANVVNYAVLEYNAFVTGPDGQVHKVEAPQRSLPPMPQQAIIQAKLGAADDIKSTTGQHDASLGQRSNETSGRAILARQREGDIGTFHYADNTVRALRYVGRIIIDLVPKIYDRARVIRIIGEDGTSDFVQINPAQQQAVVERQNPVTQAIERIYNPGVGRYDVTVTIGPSYTTKREETAQMLERFVTADRNLMRVIGDKALGALDMADSDVIQKRMKAYQLPEVLAAEKSEDGMPAQPPIPPEIQQDIQRMMAALEAAQGKIAELEQERAEKAAEIRIKEQEARIDGYRAETERLQALGPAINPQQLAQLAAQIVMDALRGPGPEGMQPGGEPSGGPMPAEAMPGGMMPPQGMPPAMSPGPMADVGPMGDPMSGPPSAPGAGMGGIPPQGPIAAPGQPQEPPPGL